MNIHLINIHAAIENTDPEVWKKLGESDNSIEKLNAILTHQRGVHPPKVAKILEQNTKI